MPIDIRFEGLRQEIDIPIALAAAVPRIDPGRVFVEAFLPTVIDRDDDRVRRTPGMEAVERLIDAPFARETRPGVEHILPVVHVQDRVTPRRCGVTRWEIDPHAPGATELRHREAVAHDRDGCRGAGGASRSRGGLAPARPRARLTGAP